jgi:hypothetical protein
MRIRVTLYVVLGCLLSPLQFGFFDCSGLPVLSFVAGALTIAAPLVAGDVVYRASTASRPGTLRLIRGTAAAVVGAAATVGLAYFTTITHICG